MVLGIVMRLDVNPSPCDNTLYMAMVECLMWSPLDLTLALPSDDAHITLRDPFHIGQCPNYVE